MAAGYFAGLALGFFLIVIGVEVGWYLHAADGTKLQNLVFFSLAGAAAVCVALGFTGKIPIFYAVLMPVVPVAAWGLMVLSERLLGELIARKDEAEQERNLLYTVSQMPDNSNAFRDLGDFYVKRGRYEKALGYYRRAYELHEFPPTREKIRLAERFLRQARGETRLCNDCGAENPPGVLRCEKCGGAMSGVLSAWEDLRKQKRLLFKYLLVVIFAPFGVILLLALVIVIPVWLALPVWLLAMYLALRFLFSW